MLQGRSQERDEIDPDFTKICGALGANEHSAASFFVIEFLTQCPLLE
jgi:hypothetical protein